MRTWAKALVTALALAVATPGARAAGTTGGDSPPVAAARTLTIRLDAPAPIAPGVIGIGAQFSTMNDVKDWCDAGDAPATCDAKLRAALPPLLTALRAGGMSWSWGVFVGTGGDPANGENPWGGKMPLSPEGFCAVARAAGLRSIAFAIPLTEYFPDGRTYKRGMRPPPVKTIDEAGRAWVLEQAPKVLARVGCEEMVRYVGMGTEVDWSGVATDQARRDQLALADALAAKVGGPRVKVVVYAAMGARYLDVRAIGTQGIPQLKMPANPMLGINPNVYALKCLALGTCVLDLHAYQSMPQWRGGVDVMTDANRRLLMDLGRINAGFLRVCPRQWGGTGDCAPGVNLEFAPQGGLVDETKEACPTVPWEVVVGAVDQVRQCVADGNLACYWWGLSFRRVEEWCYDGERAGQPTTKGAAIAFAIRDYERIALPPAEDGPVRALVSSPREGTVVAAGVNASLAATTVNLKVTGGTATVQRVEVSDPGGVRDIAVGAPIPAGALWRATLAAPGVR